MAAAKVRRAQDAVINGRPFAENLVKVTGSSLRIAQVYLQKSTVTPQWQADRVWKTVDETANLISYAGAVWH